MVGGGVKGQAGLRQAQLIALYHALQERPLLTVPGSAVKERAAMLGGQQSHVALTYSYSSQWRDGYGQIR